MIWFAGLTSTCRAVDGPVTPARTGGPAGGDQSFELEDAERGHDLAGGHAGAGDQVVDAGRLIVKLAQERSLRVGECQLGGMTDRRLVGIGADLADQWSELFHDVVDGLDQAGTVADQAMAAPAGETIGWPGNGEDLAILLHGVPRGRQRPAARGRLDDQHAQGQAGDDPIPLREQVGQRTLSHGHFADQRAPASTTARARSSCSGG